MNYIILLILISFTNLFSNSNLEKVSLQLSWLHQFQFAGYYMAKEKGFYKDHGLDVEIKEFKYGINQVNDILNFTSTYGVGRSSLIVDKLEGKNIVALAAIYQNSPMVLLTRQDSNISTPKDLINKNIMLTQDARSTVSIHAMIQSQGVKHQDVNFQSHSFNLDDLINRNTDAMGCYLSNEPFQLDKKNIPFNIINPKDYGFDFYGDILFTSQKELEEHTKRVSNFYNATIKGWEYSFNHINETVDIIYKKYNTQNKTKEALLFEANILKKLSGIEEGNFGKLDNKKVEEIKKIYLLLGFKNNTDGMDDFIYNPNKLFLSKHETMYLKKYDVNFSIPSFEAFSDSNSLKGITFDFLEIINKKIPLSMKINVLDNDIAIKKLKENNIQIKPVYFKNDLNLNFVNYSQTMSSYKIGIATLKDKNFISSTGLLSGKKVGIRKNSTFTNQIKEKYPEINFIETKSLDTSLKMLSENKIFAVVDVLPSLTYKILRNEHSNIKISGTTEFKFDLKFMVNKENRELLSIINKAINNLTTKEKNNIFIKYNTVNYEVIDNYDWIYKFLIPIIIIIVIILNINRRLSKEIKRRNVVERRLKQIANTDQLTKIYNRRRIILCLKQEIRRFKRYNRTFALIFFDIDEFKNINDIYGHQTADDVLRELSTLVKNGVRETDYFGRWGGEEFLIILPETSKKEAFNTAVLLKNKINEFDFKLGEKVTCSFGVTEFKKEDTKSGALIRVDDLMYEVKANGKNDVKVD